MGVDVNQLRHPKERLWGGVMAVIGALVWGLVGIALVVSVLRGALLPLIQTLVEVGIAILVLHVIASLTRAYIFGHYVMVGPKQFPHIEAMVREGARALGLSNVPTTFVYNSHGVMNAMAVRLVGNRYVWLTSAIIDADNEQQLRFVIGHELGHHAAGHLDFGKRLLKLPAHAIPFLFPAYSRGRELTCDRVGAALANDLHAARTALQMLASGSARLNGAMNTQAFEDQEALVPSLAGWVLAIISTYPRLTLRVSELTRSDRSIPRVA